LSIRTPRPVSTTQLGVDILDSVNIANTVGQVATLADDISRSQEVINRVLTYVNTQLSSFEAKARERAWKSTPELKQEALTYFPSLFSFVTNNLRNQTIQAAGGYRITSTMLGQETKIYSMLNQLDLLAYIMFDLPDRVAKIKAERYYNTLFSPDLPSDRDAFFLYRNGYWSKSQVVSRKREIDGLTPTDADRLTELEEWQIGKPSLRDAYLMYCKGLVNRDYFFNIAQKGMGWSFQDATKLFDHLSYDPSISELLRLTDLIPLDAKWISKKLDALGLNLEDKMVFWDAIDKRQVRDEINKAWSLLLDCYQWGLFTETSLRSLLDNWKFSKTEVDLRIQTGELLKTKLRVKLLRDAEIYLYRKAVIDEPTLLNRLTTIGIGVDIANAIVRNEAAKKGIDWTIEE
jgi:hypothetical protein